MPDDWTRIVGLKYWPEKGLVELEREQVFDVKLSPPSRKKEPIKRWSKKSKRRFAAMLAKSKVEFGSIMTLTFPEDFSVKSGTLAKKVLKRFITKFRRRYPHVEYVWIMEFQSNGQPHFHVLSNIGGSQIDLTWLGGNWAQSVLFSPPESWSEHRAMAENIYRVHSHKRAWEGLRSTDGAQRYLLSYIGKEYQKTIPDDFTDVGRFWGSSKGVREEVRPDESWPIDEAGFRSWLSECGLERVASWDYIPKYVHVPPVARRGA